MKKILLTIISLCLIVASIFGLYSGVLGVKDVLGNLQTYKQAEANSGLRQIEEELLPGIDQLSENLNVYLDGVQQVADGRAQLADGYAQYAAGQAALAEGAQQLREGEAALADGQKQIDDNTQAYNEGKEKIAMLEGYMPLIEGIAGAAQNVRDFNAGLPFIGETIDTMGGQLRASVMNLLANSAAVSAISDMVGMDIGDLLRSDPTDTSICGSVVAMYYDGLAQLKQYEDGLAQLIAAEGQLADGEAALAEGKAQLQQGYADYAAGQAQLADGERQLAEGEAQLAQFEEGQVTLLVGLTRLLSQPAYQNNYVGQVYPTAEVPEPIFANLVNNIEESDREKVRAAIYPGFYDTADTNLWTFPAPEGEGKVVCPSMLDILRGDDFLGESFNPANDLFMQENGGIMVRNGYPVVNLYVADKIADAGLAYINEYQGAAVMNEVIGKLVSYALMLVASVAGLLAGLFGIIALFGKGAGAAAVFGCISAISAIAAVVWSFIKGGFKGYAFGVTTGAENPWGHIIGDITGKQQLKAMVILAVVALLFWIVAHMVKKAAKKAKNAVKAQAYAAAAPVAQPVYAAPAQPAQPVYTAPAAPVAPAAPAVSAAEAAAAAAQKAAEEAKAAVAAGDMAAAQKAAAAAEAAAEAAAKAAAAE